MRGQTWFIALLIGLMCILRFSMSAFGYAAPHWFMEEIGISVSANPQMPYAIRVWAVRDIVLSVLVAFASPAGVKLLLVSCAAIDFTDIVSAYLSSVTGTVGTSENWLLKVTATAIAALLLELAALVLLMRQPEQSVQPLKG